MIGTSASPILSPTASGAPELISPLASLLPQSLTFGSADSPQAVGTIGPPQEIALTNTGADGAAPMVRTPDALESTIQKATDIGAIGIIVPTVDVAHEARDAARFSRYPPVGRRSTGGGCPALE